MTRPISFAPPNDASKIYRPPPWTQKLKVPKIPPKHNKSGFSDLKKYIDQKSKIFRPPLTGRPIWLAPLRGSSDLARPPNMPPPIP